MKKVLIQLAFFSFVLAPILACADDGREVVVVYNKRMPGSKEVAEYYAELRQVPERQIFGFALTTNDVMSRAEFRNDLQLPLAHDLEAYGLWKLARTMIPVTNGEPKHAVRQVVASKIRYAVLCYGVPLKIASDPNLHEVAPAALSAPLRRDDASVDSELAWLPLLDTKPPLMGPMPNWNYGVTNTALLNPTNGILMVARLDGPSADIARGLVDKALQAERDGLWGRAYFDARGLAPTNPLYLGDQWILTAAEICRGLGFQTFVDDRPDTFPADFPMSQIAIYCGWYAGEVCGPFAQPKVEFMPGAFAYHLHSFSAATLRDPNNYWVGPLLARGATCTMGCVNEPYLGLTPNIAVFISRFTTSRFTFGEAAWAAQPALSWQTTVVGDPLYCPFERTDEAWLQELETRHSPLVDWAILRSINIAFLRGRLLGQLADILVNLPETAQSAVLTEKLADYYSAEGRRDAAIATYEKALQLDPSPEQRIRLRLTLGKLLQLNGSDAEARLDYQQLLNESPDYPGKAAIQSEIISLPSSDPNSNK